MKLLYLQVLVTWLLALAVSIQGKADQDLLRQPLPIYTPLDSSSSSSGGGQYKSHGGHSSSSSSALASAGGQGGGSYSSLSSEQTGGASNGRIVPAGYGINSFDGGKQLGGGGSSQSQGSFSSGGGSSYEFGGTADSTGGYPSVYPASQSSGGYPTSSSAHASASHQLPTEQGVQGQVQNPAYTYYYQHYPSGSATGGHGGHEEGGGGGLFGGHGGGEGLGGNFGLAGLGGIGGLKGLGIIGAIAKGVLAIKPFLILGLLFLIAFPILLFFIPLPIITISGNTNMVPAGTPGTTRSGPTVTSYLTNLSQKVLSSEECLERVLCKMPQAPENYQKKMRSLWDQYGPGLIKNTRVTRGLNAYFDTGSAKNKNLKCDQRFQCSNKFL